jgi:hypothetical protein
VALAPLTSVVEGSTASAVLTAGSLSEHPATHPAPTANPKSSKKVRERIDGTATS